MQIIYDPRSRTLHICFCSHISHKTRGTPREIATGIIIECDEQDRILGIDILDTSHLEPNDLLSITSQIVSDKHPLLSIASLVSLATNRGDYPEIKYRMMDIRTDCHNPMPIGIIRPPRSLEKYGLVSIYNGKRPTIIVETKEGRKFAEKIKELASKIGILCSVIGGH